MTPDMYLKLAQELVELKTEYEETVKNIQLFQEVGKTIELRNRIEQLRTNTYKTKIF